MNISPFQLPVISYKISPVLSLLIKPPIALYAPVKKPLDLELYIGYQIQFGAMLGWVKMYFSPPSGFPTAAPRLSSRRTTTELFIIEAAEFPRNRDCGFSVPSIRMWW
jgi:hypothetical protein